MTRYLYPHNLKAKANIWLWHLRDFAIIGIAILLSIIALVYLRWLVPAALTLCYAFLTIQLDDTSMLDYIRYAVRYFIMSPQYFEWSLQIKSQALNEKYFRSRHSKKRA